MPKQSRKWTHAPERTLSGRMATVATAFANRLVIANVLDSRGGLRRFLVLPAFLVVARALRWWSRSYLGQRLGLRWSRQTYRDGHDKSYSPSDIGDSWERFQHGRVTMFSPDQKTRSGKRS